MANEATAATTGTAAAPDARAASSSMTKAERKQLERTRASLAFLDRIAHISVTGTTFFDEYERVLFDVAMNDSSDRPSLSARATRKDAKKRQPVVDYSAKKSLATLKGMHQAVHEWSAKHNEAPAPDGSSQCAYCKQFNSPVALELWKWSATAQQQHAQQPANTAALTVVVNTSVLERYNRCLASYLECARNVPTDELEHACPGMTHIPVIVASFIANEPTTSSAVGYAVVDGCSIM